MRTIQVEKRRKVNYADYVRRSALAEDVSEIIREPCTIIEGGRIVAVYLVADDIPESFVEVVKKVKVDRNLRTDGLKTESRIFGYSPRETIRKDFCSSTSLAAEMPQEHAMICNFGATLADYYKKCAPEIYEDHARRAEAIKQDWKIKGSPFTSGIINRNNPLKYHLDSGNLDKVYSNMVAFKHHCEGGYLAMPEFDVGFEIANKSITLFDGQDIIHGVTPFRLLSPDAYRYTLVYYSLKAMWKCEPVDEELARIRKRKTEREVNRYRRLKGEIPNEIAGSTPSKRLKENGSPQ